MFGLKSRYAHAFRGFDKDFSREMNMYEAQTDELSQNAHMKNARDSLKTSEDYRYMTLFLTFSTEYSIFAFLFLSTALLVDYWLAGGLYYVPFVAIAISSWLLTYTAPLIQYHILSLDSEHRIIGGLVRFFSRWYMNASWRLCCLHSPIDPLTDPTDLARWEWLGPLIKDQADFLESLKSSIYLAKADRKGTVWHRWPTLVQENDRSR